jgi:hypothetical protein
MIDVSEQIANGNKRRKLGFNVPEYTLKKPYFRASSRHKATTSLLGFKNEVQLFQ